MCVVHGFGYKVRLWATFLLGLLFSCLSIRCRPGNGEQALLMHALVQGKLTSFTVRPFISTNTFHLWLPSFARLSCVKGGAIHANIMYRCFVGSWLRA
jgi:hypothetical protein